MTETNDQHDEPVVMNLVDDPVLTDSHPIRALLAFERDTPRGARFVCEKIDRRPDSLLLTTR